jgi:hypothetical protein
LAGAREEECRWPGAKEEGRCQPGTREELMRGREYGLISHLFKFDFRD